MLSLCYPKFMLLIVSGIGFLLDYSWGSSPFLDLVGANPWLLVNFLRTESQFLFFSIRILLQYFLRTEVSVWSHLLVWSGEISNTVFSSSSKGEFRFSKQFKLMLWSNGNNFFYMGRFPIPSML